MNENSFVELSAELYTLAIGLNLFTISENCDINKKRPPLYPRLKSNNRAASFSSVSMLNAIDAAPPASVKKPAFEPWTGVIFANGTVLNEKPTGFSWEGHLVTKNGVTFHDVSALTTDSKAPDPIHPHNGTHKNGARSLLSRES